MPGRVVDRREAVQIEEEDRAGAGLAAGLPARRSKKCALLGRPVSASWLARRVRPSCRASRSLMLLDTPAIATNSPAGSRTGASVTWAWKVVPSLYRAWNWMRQDSDALAAMVASW